MKSDISPTLTMFNNKNSYMNFNLTSCFHDYNLTVVFVTV